MKVLPYTLQTRALFYKFTIDSNMEQVSYRGLSHIPGRVSSSVCLCSSFKRSYLNPTPGTTLQDYLVLIEPLLTASAEGQGQNEQWRSCLQSELPTLPFQARVRRKPDSTVCPTAVPGGPHIGKRCQTILASTHFHIKNDCQHFNRSPASASRKEAASS